MSRGAHWPKGPASTGLEAFADAAARPGPLTRRLVGEPPPRKCEVCGAPVTLSLATWKCSAHVGCPAGASLPDPPRGYLWERDGIAWAALLPVPRGIADTWRGARDRSKPS